MTKSGVLCAPKKYTHTRRIRCEKLLAKVSRRSSADLDRNLNGIWRLLASHVTIIRISIYEIGRAMCYGDSSPWDFPSSDIHLNLSLSLYQLSNALYFTHAVYIKLCIIKSWFLYYYKFFIPKRKKMLFTLWSMCKHRQVCKKLLFQRCTFVCQCVTNRLAHI